MNFIFGNNVDTDVIIPARYLTSSELSHLASHCMEDIDKSFAVKVKQGDIIIAAQNFGCGSSREHAPLAIKASGVSYVIAHSFARIFYRNAINIGLTILECTDKRILNIGTEDVLKIDTEKGMIFNKTRDEMYKSTIFPPFIQEIIKRGGLLHD